MLQHSACRRCGGRAERAAKQAQVEERGELREQLKQWERREKRKLGKADLQQDPELAAKYARYRELSS